MALELMSTVALSFYTPVEALLLAALHRHGSSPEFGTYQMYEKELNGIVNVRASTLRAALAQLQRDCLLKSDMVHCEGERFEVRRWSLDLSSFCANVDERVQHVRKEMLRRNQSTSELYCPICEYVVPTELAKESFRCAECQCWFDERVRSGASCDTSILNILQEMCQKACAEHK